MKPFRRSFLVLVVFSFALAVQAQSPDVTVSEHSALEAALGLTDPAARARALEAFLTSYPRSTETLRALTAAMDAFQLADDPLDAEFTAAAVLRLNPDDSRAQALIASAKSSLPPTVAPEDSPADPLAYRVCRVALQYLNELGFGDWEVVLSFRDSSRCNRTVANWIWDRILKRQKVLPMELPAVVLSSTTNDVVLSTLNGDIYRTKGFVTASYLPTSDAFYPALPQPGTGDVHATLQMSLPYPLPFGAVTTFRGTLTRYSPQPFSFDMEGVDLPHWSEFGCEITSGNLPFVRIPVIEYLLFHRDTTHCAGQAADLIWKNFSDHRHEFTARVVSASSRDMAAALIDKPLQTVIRPWESPVDDLHVTFARPFPFVPKSGDVVKVIGQITGYAADPFQFRMDEAESSELICAWVRDAGAENMSFDEWLYVLGNVKGSCSTEAEKQVWAAIYDRQSKKLFSFSVHVISATEKVILVSMDSRPDQEIDLKIEFGKPVPHAPSPGANIQVTGYLTTSLPPLPQQHRPLTLSMINGRIIDPVRQDK